MVNLIRQLLNSRLLALIFKEINQITRDKNLLVFLLVPPTIQLLIYGYSLNPDVQRLNLGVIDYAQTYQIGLSFSRKSSISGS
jgi:ABC-2 type transport system permease protein